MALLEAGKLAMLDMVGLREVKKHGSISGQYAHKLNGFGQLSRDYTPRGYCVLSYDTPIGWYEMGQWIVPDVTYSRTTTGHQSVLKWAISVVEMGAYAVHDTMAMLENHRDAFRRRNRPSVDVQVARTLAAQNDAAEKHHVPVDTHDPGCPRGGKGYVPGTDQLCLACALILA